MGRMICAITQVVADSFSDVIDPIWTLRHPTPSDAHELARVHTQCWRETYGMCLPTDPTEASALERRQELWSGLLRDEPDGQRLVLAEAGDEVIGFAMAVPTDHDNPPSTQLRMLYVLRRHHGSGAGQALLDAVVGSEPCQLWVARENPRAHRFYRRNGFVPDGTEKQDERAGGLWVMHWVRQQMPAVVGPAGIEPTTPAV